ncbi:MAG TPA: hypothetical protein VHG27_06670 [Xanthobacteraceae bacterium]|nr:hypothetical protein [Xanthobacteraceae bacterium]
MLALLAVLTACSGDSYLGARTVVVQNRFDHLTCEQIDAGMKSTQTRIDELNGLIVQARREAGGNVIGAAVYGPTLAEAQGNMRIYRETFAKKNCAAILPAAR